MLNILEREIPADVGVDLPEGLVYHYTDAFGFDGIVRSGKLRATHYLHMNDRRELLEGEELMRNIAEELRDQSPPNSQRRVLFGAFLANFEPMTLRNMVKDLYIACFSAAPDSLEQWRAYGGRGGGYAFGVTFGIAPDNEQTRAAKLGVGGTMLRVRYLDDGVRAQLREEMTQTFDCIERHLNDANDPEEGRVAFDAGMIMAYRRAGRVAPLLKNAAFKAEEEWRIIAMLNGDAPFDTVKSRPSANGMVPYIEIPLDPGKSGPAKVEHVLVGPTQDPARGVRSAQLFLTGLGYDVATAERIVEASKVPFRG